jgi:hypothetical protein
VRTAPIKARDDGKAGRLAAPAGFLSAVEDDGRLDAAPPLAQLIRMSGHSAPSARVARKRTTVTPAIEPGA